MQIRWSQRESHRDWAAGKRHKNPKMRRALVRLQFAKNVKGTGEATITKMRRALVRPQIAKIQNQLQIDLAHSKSTQHHDLLKGMARPVLGSGIGETSRPVTSPTVQDSTGWGGETLAALFCVMDSDSGWCGNRLGRFTFFRVKRGRALDRPFIFPATYSHQYQEVKVRIPTRKWEK